MSAITDQIEEPPIHSSVTYSSCGPTVRPSEVLRCDFPQRKVEQEGASRCRAFRERRGGNDKHPFNRPQSSHFLLPAHDRLRLVSNRLI